MGDALVYLVCFRHCQVGQGGEAAALSWNFQELSIGF